MEHLIKLTASDCISVQHILRYYAAKTPSLDSEDKEAIHKLANKFSDENIFYTQVGKSSDL